MKNGAKLRNTIVKEYGQVDKVTNYINGFVYEDNALSFFPFSEGRVLYNGSNSFEYEYWMKDHLGNTRLSFTSEESEINISQTDFYYQFGIRIGSNIAGDENKYLYNGKELFDDNGLYWYHYGARFYNPQIGQWHTMDPWDQYHSPYSYVGNSPIYFVDRDGKGGFSFSAEFDFGGGSRSYGIGFEFGNYDKFQIGVFENTGGNYFDINNNGVVDPSKDLLTGINFGGSINFTVNKNTKDVVDLQGRTNEVEISATIYTGSIATDPNSDAMFYTGGLGGGLGATFYQQNVTKLIASVTVVENVKEKVKRQFYRFVDWLMNPPWKFIPPQDRDASVTVEPLLDYKFGD